MKTQHSTSTTKATFVALVAAFAAWAAVSAQPLVDFQFNEGQGFTTTDDAHGLVGVFGYTVDPTTDAVVLTDTSPSAAAGDRSIATEGNGFLVADDNATQALAFARDEAFTIETWVNLTPGLAKTVEGFATYGGSYKLGLKAGEPVFTLFGVVDLTNTAAFLPEGEWKHIAAVWQPGVGVTFYQNGEATVVPHTTLTPTYKDHFLVIGAERFLNNVNASFDRLRIHRGALTQAQLDNDPANPKAAYENTVVAYNFNEAEFPVKNSRPPELPSMSSVDFVPAYTGPQWTSDTPSGSAGDFALAFNMDSPSVRQRINVTAPGIDLAASGTNYTLEAWIKLPARGINERMVIFRTAGAGPRVSLSIAANRTLHTTIFGTEDFTSSVRVPNDDRWHHVAVVCEDFARVHFHLDGVRAQTVNRTKNGTASGSGSANLLIGMESDTRYFKGLLDRVRIHDVALAVEALDYPAIPGLPRITANPSNVIADPGTTVTFEAAGSSDTAATYQWRYRANRNDATSTVVLNATTPTLTLNNVTATRQGFYSFVIKNSVGESESAIARLSVRLAPGTLAPLWQILPGERDYITGFNNTASLRDLERGLAYDPVTGHLLVVARSSSTAIRKIAILDAATGAEVGTTGLKTTGISGGTFPLSRIVVTDDGVIYASNFGSTSGTTATSFLRVYRWADENAQPTVAYAGNPTNAQYGKNLAVRGTGASTQLLLETRGSFVVVLTTTDGVTFGPAIVQTDAQLDDFALGTAFGEGDTFWGKNQFEPLYQWEVDLATRTGTMNRSFVNQPGNTFSNFSFSEDRQYLAGLNITPEGPDLVELYVVSDLDREPVLVDTGAFSTDNANGVFGGNVVFGGNRLFALNSNNGIVAYRLPGDPPPTATIQRSGGSVVIEWNSGGTLHVTDKIVGGTWTDTALTSPAVLPENMLKSVQFFRVGN